MQPDLVWIKNRDQTDAHCVFDAVRGATKVLHSDATTAEVTDTDTLDSFASDGFQVDADVKVNTNAEKYASWNWKANGSGSSNTDGSINTASTSVDTTAGFSISKYVGTGSNGTIGHGLGVVPKIYIIKNFNFLRIIIDLLALRSAEDFIRLSDCDFLTMSCNKTETSTSLSLTFSFLQIFSAFL